MKRLAFASLGVFMLGSLAFGGEARNAKKQLITPRYFGEGVYLFERTEDGNLYFGESLAKFIREKKCTPTAMAPMVINDQGYTRTVAYYVVCR